MDKKIHPDIKEAAAPVMPDAAVAEEESKGQEYLDMMEAIKEESSILSSDIQTAQSIKLAMKEQLGIRYPAKLWKLLLRSDIVVELVKKRNVPKVEYSTDNISSEEERLSFISDVGMKRYYTIRNHEKHTVGIENNNTQEYLDANFFSFIKHRN